MKYKYIILTGLLAIQFSIAHGQWSTDPENPGIVCDLSGIQNNMNAFADDNGGVYVFWLDNRLNDPNPRQVYGQRYDADGYALWEEGGRLILSHYNRLHWYSVSRLYNNEIIIGWISDSDGEFGDSLKFQRLDDNGMKVWSDDLLVSNTGLTPNAILYLNAYHIIHDNSGYCIAIETTYYGGSNRNRITRFSSDGVLTGPYTGAPEGSSYGSSGLQSAYDANDNVYLYYSSGNGSGADLYCLKLDVAGDTVWGPVNVLDGTLGLNYQFTGIGDENGITFIWQGTGEGGSSRNIYTRRLNADGTYDWGGATTSVCVADGQQSNYYVEKSGDHYYITWADARPGTDPGNYDIYAQKFDVNGIVSWQENGILAVSLNTYIPYPKFGFFDDNSMIICHQSTSNAGFVAQKVMDDGTVPWDADGNQICVKDLNPFYGEHIEIYTGDKTIAVWVKSNPGGGSDNIYITRVDDIETIGISELKEKQIHSYPNPASGEVTVVLPDNMTGAEVSLTDILGKEVLRNFFETSNKDHSLRISTTNLDPGTYILLVKSKNEIFSHKLVVK